MEALYEYLRKNKLDNEQRVYENVPKLDEKKLNKVIEDIIVRIKPFQFKRQERSQFSFSANASLAGLPFPCEAIKCRMNNVEQLARFAALYSDRVIIPSPFDHYLESGSIQIERLIGDIMILNYLRPLVQADIVGFSTNTFLICKNCLRELTRIENDFSSKLSIIEPIIKEEYLRNIKAMLVWEGTPVIYITGPHSYGFHGSMVIKFRYYIPKEILAVLDKKKSVELSPEIMKQTFLSALISPILDDLTIQNITLNNTDYNYLTDRNIDVQLIDALNVGEKATISKALIEGLVHKIPLIANARLDNILKLRQEEGESFLVYRDAVSSFLDQAGNLTQSQFREAYRDVIQPEVNKINLTISNNRKAIMGSLRDDLIILAGAISFGIYTGILSTDASKFLANIGACTVGGASFLANEYAKAKKLFNEPDSVKGNKFYFLWKLQQ